MHRHRHAIANVAVGASMGAALIAAGAPGALAFGAGLGFFTLLMLVYWVIGIGIVQ